MRYIKYLALALIVALTACEKNDLETDKEPENVMATPVFNSPSVWTTARSWTPSEQGFQTSITDSAITSTIVNEGLVLVYGKEKDVPKHLPGEMGKSYWHYQIEVGVIQIHAKVSDSASFEKDQSFSYFILSKNQLSKFEEKGISIIELIDMPYEQVKAIVL